MQATLAVHPTTDDADFQRGVFTPVPDCFLHDAIPGSFEEETCPRQD